MERPLISVVVPVYNVEKFLHKCVDSILSQTYDNLEVFLIDDGSTDYSGEICDNYAVEDSRIRVVHQRNAGLSAARNTGIGLVRGKYLTFIDSDDCISNDMIEYLYNLLVASNADMSLCQLQKIDENDVFESLDISGIKDCVVENGPENCLAALLSDRRLDTVAWSKLYLTSMFSDILYPVGKYHEDVFTTYKIISKCSRIAIGGEKKYFYRIRKQSITSSSFSEKHLDLIEGKIEYNNFIESNYPNLKKYSQAEILYACNTCVARMLKSKYYNEKMLDQIQRYYREYESQYLMCPYVSLKGKVFSLFAFVNLNLLFKAYSFFYGFRRV